MLFIGGIGMPEVLFIALVVLLFFGGKKIHTLRTVPLRFPRPLRP